MCIKFVLFQWHRWISHRNISTDALEAKFTKVVFQHNFTLFILAAVYFCVLFVNSLFSPDQWSPQWFYHVVVSLSIVSVVLKCVPRWMLRLLLQSKSTGTNKVTWTWNNVLLEVSKYIWCIASLSINLYCIAIYVSGLGHLVRLG